MVCALSQIQSRSVSSGLLSSSSCRDSRVAGTAVAVEPPCHLEHPTADSTSVTHIRLLAALTTHLPCREVTEPGSAWWLVHLAVVSLPGTEERSY